MRLGLNKPSCNMILFVEPEVERWKGSARFQVRRDATKPLSSLDSTNAG